MAQREISAGVGKPQIVKLQPASGTWLWILQRLSAWGLLLFLGVHLAFHYFLLPSNPQLMDASAAGQSFQLYPFLYALNGSLLLLCTLFHGFNGVRNIVFDYVVSPGSRRFTTVVLTLLGLLLFILGAVTLWALSGVMG